ncbi:hypothetical protein NL676_030448 [Syzygium grande]|nr:hypothetical protein NL676_030448 [Syzygium grande]
MEKFFALIRSTREVHDRLRGGGPLSSEESEKSREDRRKAEEDRPGPRESAWNPTFQPEDFSLDPILYKPSATPSVPDVPSSSGRKARAGPSQKVNKTTKEKTMMIRRKQKKTTTTATMAMAKAV